MRSCTGGRPDSRPRALLTGPILICRRECGPTGERVGSNAWQAVAVKRRVWAFVLLWPLTVAAIALLLNAHRSAVFRVAVAAVVYGCVVAALSALVVVRALLNGVPLRDVFFRRRTSSIPVAVSDTLPKVMWVVRNREPARLRPLLLDGPLLARDNIAYTALLAPWLAAALVKRASTDPTAADDHAIFDAALEAAAILPTAADPQTVQRWLTQLRGGEVSYRIDRPSQFTFTDLSALLAIGAGAATAAALGRQEIYSQYTSVANAFTHGQRVPAAWRADAPG